jgi:hypothetical protein
MDQKLAISELERLAFEACEASKKAETFEQRYQAAMVFAQCQSALHLDRIASVLEDGQVAILDVAKI